MMDQTGANLSTMALRPLSAADMPVRIGELAALLMDAVAAGSSVNFLSDLTHDAAADFWQRQFPAVAEGRTIMFVAEQGPRIVGCVLLMHAPQPNAPYRAEIGKMIVHSAVRRRGLGRALLRMAEDAARSSGRTLLVLDTEAGRGGDYLYRSEGWIAAGTIPGYAFTPDRRPADATFFYKRLA